MTDTMCSESYLLGINIFSIVLTFPMVIIFAILCVLLVVYSKTFHPLFTLSFILLIFSYAICNACVLLKSIFQLFDEKNSFITCIDMIYSWAYLYIQPCVVIGLLERLCATIFVRSYEHSRRWVCYIFAQAIGIGVVQYEYILVQSGEYTDTAKNIQLALSILICLCLIALFFVNRQLTLSSRHRSKLTVRYQLAENVKALRTFVPFVVIDNCISISYVFSMIFFQVDFNFDLEVCRKLPNYTVSFAVFRAICLVSQLGMPLLVVKQHSTIWNKLQAQFGAKKSTVHKIIDKDLKKVFKIHNVLGMNIAGTQADYFSQLKIQWLT